MKLTRGMTGVAVAAALIAAPGAAYASAPATRAHTVHRHATRPASPRQVAADMLAGASEFADTRPECRTIVRGAVYRCTIVGGAPYDDFPSLTHAQQTQLTLAPPGDPDASLAADDAYQVKLLEGWGWNATQAHQYASGNFSDIAAGTFAGINEPTVNAVTHRVNGGCEALDSTGAVWDCYLGEAAVRAGQATRHFLGTKVPGPLAK